MSGDNSDFNASCYYNNGDDGNGGDNDGFVMQ